MMLGKLARDMQVNKTELLLHTIKELCVKLLEQNIGKNLPDMGLGSDFFFGYNPKSVGNKTKK